MTIRLYDSAWVLLRESEQPQQVRKDGANAGIYHVADFDYDIDGRPYHFADKAPEIRQVLNLEVARQRGLSTHFAANFASPY